MKAKLIKEKDWYDLYRIDEDGKRVTFASTQDYKQKLSLKNCQAIERGYDLDELADDFIRCPEDMRTLSEDREINSFKKGFQKALEILGDQRFTDKDLDKAIEYGHESRMPFNEDWYNEFIQSLQQNEWDVEVEMEPVFDIEYSNNGYRTEKFNKTEYKPKLDANGCLILKRV